MPKPEECQFENFETSLKELEKLVENLDRDETTLHEMVAGYERGVGLLKTCRETLDHARLRVEVLQRHVAGDVDAVAYEPDEMETDEPVAKGKTRRVKTAGDTLF